MMFTPITIPADPVEEPNNKRKNISLDGLFPQNLASKRLRLDSPEKLQHTVSFQALWKTLKEHFEWKTFPADPNDEDQRWYYGTCTEKKNGVDGVDLFKSEQAVWDYLATNNSLRDKCLDILSNFDQVFNLLQRVFDWKVISDKGEVRYQDPLGETFQSKLQVLEYVKSNPSLGQFFKRKLNGGLAETKFFGFPFKSVFNILVSKGWKKYRDPTSKTIYFASPQCIDRGKGVLGTDLFKDQEQLIEFLTKNEKLTNECLQELKKVKLPDNLTFNDVYPILKQKHRWKHFNGDLLHQWYYATPDCAGKTKGIEGVNMFKGEQAVMDYLRSNPALAKSCIENAQDPKFKLWWPTLVKQFKWKSFPADDGTTYFATGECSSPDDGIPGVNLFTKQKQVVEYVNSKPYLCKYFATLDDPPRHRNNSVSVDDEPESQKLFNQACSISVDDQESQTQKPESQKLSNQACSVSVEESQTQKLSFNQLWPILKTRFSWKYFASNQNDSNSYYATPNCKSKKKGIIGVSLFKTEKALEEFVNSNPDLKSQCLKLLNEEKIDPVRLEIDLWGVKIEINHTSNNYSPSTNKSINPSGQKSIRLSADSDGKLLVQINN